MNDIHITTAGKALDDPQLRFTSSGKAVASVRIVIGHRKKSGDQWVDAGATFLDVQAWDKLAENLAESVRKGDRIIVTGRLATEEWEGKDGEKRTTQRISADDIGLSVRWTTATAKQAARQSPFSGGSGGQEADPWAAKPGASGEPPF